MASRVRTEDGNGHCGEAPLSAECLFGGFRPRSKFRDSSIAVLNGVPTINILHDLSLKDEGLAMLTPSDPEFLNDANAAIAAAPESAAQTSSPLDVVAEKEKTARNWTGIAIGFTAIIFVAFFASRMSGMK